MNRLFAAWPPNELMIEQVQTLWLNEERPALQLQDCLAITLSVIHKAAHYEEDGLVLAVIGKPYLISGHTVSHSLGLAKQLAQLYRDEGERFIEKLQGSFAVVLVDQKRGLLFAATDRMGSYPLTFLEREGGCLVGSDCHSLRAAHDRVLSLDWQGLYDYFFFHMIPAPHTAFKGVERLRAAECISYRAGSLKRRRYWQPQFRSPENLHFEEQKQRFKSLLTNAVQISAEDAETGAFLSGGTDSSTVVGLLAKINSASVKSFSIGFDEPGYDETSFARISAAHFQSTHTEYRLSPDDIISAVPKIAKASEQPFGNSSIIPTFYCAQLARQHGCERLLGGDGGDEFFGGNERYAEMAKIEHYAHKLKPWRGMLDTVDQFGPNWRVFNRMRSLLRLVDKPVHARLQHYNLMMRMGDDELIEQRLLLATNRNWPWVHLQELYEQMPQASMLNRQLLLDWQLTLADNDLPKVNTACDLVGIDVAYPFLNDMLVEFSTQLPDDYKLKGNYLRWFFKEALKDFLPPQVINKQKHGFGMPFGTWIVKHPPLKAFVQDALSGMRERHIVCTDMIDLLMTKHLGVHAGYYGTMIWLIVMLEHWLRAHGMHKFNLKHH
ncbi:MAG: asparagine synthetase [Pseudomonadota bacterium]